MLATVLALAALGPVGAASMITGDFSQMVYKPSRTSVHRFLRHRLWIISASVALWTAALIVHLTVTEASVLVLIITGALVGLFTLLGYGMSPYVMFPSLRSPRWVPAAEADGLLPGDGDVIGVEINGDARAYPVDWSFRPHLIEETVGGEPIVMSYCLLSNLGLAFRAEIDGATMKCIMPIQWENNMVIYDTAGDHLIQQIDGTVLHGRDIGTALDTYPTQIMPWSAWHALYPQTKVLHNPPAGMWDRFVRRFIGTKFLEENRRRQGPMFPTIKTFDERLPTKTEVVGVKEGSSRRAYPIQDLVTRRVVNDEIGGRSIVLVASPEGAVNVFSREVQGEIRQFSPAADGFRDDAGTHYDMRGRAEGEPRLMPFPHASRVFWLIWSNFYPDTEVAEAL